MSSFFFLMAVVNSRGLYLAALTEINIYVLTRNAERSGTVTEVRFRAFANASYSLAAGKSFTYEAERHPATLCRN